MKASCYIFVATILLIISSACISWAADPKIDASSLKEPAAIEADSLHYDKEKSLVRALGNVEVMQAGRILIADKVTYNQKDNVVTAEGNISLSQADGTTFFADEIVLHDDLKEGVIQQFRAKFADKSLMSAKKAELKDKGNLTVLEKVNYSPCHVCEEEKNKSPLWQVKANKATINVDKQKVKYNHAFFEVKGVPILYTPYLAHPTPKADRKSGFLIPKYSTSKIFGTTIKTPYYFNISPNKDMTFSPIFTSKEGAILSGEYRHLVSNGRYKLEASITNPDKVDTEGNPVDKNEVRGHIEGEGHFSLNEKWVWGFQGKRSTDDTYLRRYNFGDEDVLTSRIYSSALEDRNYITVESISFQGLKTNDDPGTTPLILPNTNMHFETSPGFKGSRWFSDGNLLALTRDEGVSSKRLSLKGGWKIPHITKSGHVFELNTFLRGDSYFVDDVLENPLDANSRKLDGFTSRVIPQAELKWAFPLVKEQIFIEPTINFIFSPYGGNPNKIPNEDSQDVEFSDENLFDSNHFTGFDRVENGPRTNYGIRGNIYNDENGDISFLLGQNYRTRQDRNFSAKSGLNSNFSDFVGRIGYQKDNLFDIAYRFRVDKNSFSFNRNAISANLDMSPVKLNMDYLAVDESFETTNNDDSANRETLIAGTSIDLSKEWSLSGNGHRNLESGEWVSTKANLLYKGDCVDISFAWFKEFTRDRDIRPNTTFSLQVSLKNLGY